MFTLLWLASLWFANASIVDIWRGPAFVVALAAYLQFGLPQHPRGWLVLGATAVWALRLAWHIGQRNVGHGEDPRYRALARRARTPLVVAQLFPGVRPAGGHRLAGLEPLYFAAQGDAAFPSALDVLGSLLFLAGLLFEAIGDAQLAAFKRDTGSRGRVMDRGLWRYSRHPNYFGEALLWWGLGAIGASAPNGWMGLAGPALMTFLLLRVSGVAMLERGLVKTRPGYGDYVARDSAFVPWWPR